MMKRILDRHEWAVDLATAVLCASALAHAYVVALERPRSPAPVGMVIAQAQRPPEPPGIRKLDQRSYELDRATLESALGAGLPGRAARIVPEIREGRAAGLRLYSVRPEGLGVLGLQNGDVITSVAGVAIASPESALNAYAKLRASDHFTITFERNGQTLSNEYRVR